LFKKSSTGNIPAESLESAPLESVDVCMNRIMNSTQKPKPLTLKIVVMQYFFVLYSMTFFYFEHWKVSFMLKTPCKKEFISDAA
jgi:hypothetical protein